MLYQVMSSDIAFSKTQTWLVTYYGLLVLGGLVGLAKLIKEGLPYVYRNCSNCVISFFPIIGVIAIFLCTYYILKYENNMKNSRAKVKKIKECHFSCVAKRLIGEYHRNYDSIWYDWLYWFPQIATLWLGWFFVSSYLLWSSNMEWIYIIIASLAGIIFAGIILIFHCFSLARKKSVEDISNRLKTVEEWKESQTNPIKE